MGLLHSHWMRSLRAYALLVSALVMTLGSRRLGVAADRLTTRTLYRALPLRLQHWLRDSGTLGVAVDAATLASSAVALPLRPSALVELIAATSVQFKSLSVPYGPLPQHRLDIFDASSRHAADADSAPVLLFVHGGAWGSGSRFIYRLCGRRLDREGFTTCVVGYRRYPTADIAQQVDDICRAIAWAEARPEWAGRPLCVLGHSSGAHVSMLAAMQRARGVAPRGDDADAGPSADRLRALVGLAGVYDIAKHYEFESKRCVHEVSPMKPAAGGPERFDSVSPALVARGLSPAEAARMPRVLLVHGTEDTTVPWTASAQMHAALCAAGAPAPECLLLEDGGHADVVVQLSGLAEEPWYACRAPAPAPTGSAVPPGMSATWLRPVLAHARAPGTAFESLRPRSATRSKMAEAEPTSSKLPAAGGGAPGGSDSRGQAGQPAAGRQGPAPRSRL